MSVVVSVLVILLLTIAFTVFFLSVFAPSESRKRFWIFIRKMRIGLDLICYWTFNLFGIIAILYAIWSIIQGILNR